MSFFKLSAGKLSEIKILKCVRLYFESEFWGNGRQTFWEDVSGNDSKISKADLLRLQCDKTQLVRSSSSTLKFTEIVQFIMGWYNKFYVEGWSNLLDVSNGQIDRYVNLANLRN